MNSILLSISSGLLLALCFPNWSLGFLAWFSLVPLLHALNGKSVKAAFGLGFLSGWVAFCIILYWILPTFHAGGVSLFVSLLFTALLSAYIGLYYGVFSAIFSRFQKILPPFLSLIIGASLWAALEFLRNFILTGFSGGILAHTQWAYWQLIQISEWTGVYGVSFLILSVNIFLFQSIQSRRFYWKALSLIGLFFLLNFFLLKKEASHQKSNPKNEIHIAILQGNIDQYKKWSDEYIQDIQNTYAILSSQVQSADLILWPETAVPGWIPEDVRIYRWLQKVAKDTKAYHLFGAVTSDRNQRYNSAFLMSPDGEILARYDKMHLVPFGEFVPFQSLLGRWVPLLNQLGKFDAGQKAQVLTLPGKAVLGASICYEGIFPEIARAQVRAGADLLANITNDGWYLDTAAPLQHFSINIFRAVENRRFVVRAGNTGISGVINPLGRLQSHTKLGEQTLMEDVAGLRTGITFYTKYGDLFAWGCTFLSLFGMAWILIKRKTYENI